MKQFGYFLVFLLLAPLLFSFWVEGLIFLAPVLGSPGLKWFYFGLLGAVVLGVILSGAIVDFIQVAIHELTHAFVGILILGGVKYIEAKSRGGGVTETERKANPVSLLAPYYLPLLTLPFLVAKLIVSRYSATANQVVDFLVGLTLGVHYVIAFRQFRPIQSDLQKTGMIVSIGMTLTLILVFLVIAVAVVLGQYGSIRTFFANAVVRSPIYYQAIGAWLRSLASRV